MKWLLVEMPAQKDLPDGKTWQCTECGCRVRSGQVHIGLKPKPHSTVRTLIIAERINDQC